MEVRVWQRHRSSCMWVIQYLLVALVPTAIEAQVRLNDVQVVGTHNSYHIPPPDAIQQLAWDPAVQTLAADYAQSAVNTTQYSHLGLYQQLDLGVRSLEIDIFPDPVGGTYDHSVVLRVAGVNGWLNNSALADPGFKVLHEPDVDFDTTCYTFSSCLGLVADWHRANPKHFPLTIFLNQKVSGLAEYLGQEGMQLLTAVMKTSTTPGPDGIIVVPEYDAAMTFEQIEAEVLKMFNRSDIVTPDEVRGNYSTLAEAVLTDSSGPGWPALDTLWGRVFLVWTPESVDDYLKLHPNLNDALSFVSSVDGNSGVDGGGVTASDPARVFIQTFENLDWSSPVTADQISSFESRMQHVHQRTMDIVKEGYMTISFADEHCVEARNNFTARQDALVTAGAQIIKTDFPTLPTHFPSSYVVR
ncbi:hypothetical protein ABBQ38_010730 [Trebouxia sp. C0009 RCD-2024]